MTESAQVAILGRDISAPAWLPGLVEALATVGEHATRAMPCLDWPRSPE